MKTSFSSSVQAMWTVFFTVYIALPIFGLEYFINNVWAVHMRWFPPEWMVVLWITGLILSHHWFSKFWTTYFKDYIHEISKKH